MTIEHKRTADDIAQEIDAIRQRMDATLDEIELRVRPVAWMREGLGSLSLKDKGRYVVWIATLARRYPVPVLVVGVAAVAIFVLRQRHVHFSKVEKERASLHRLARAVDAAKGAIRSRGSHRH
ncbi:MAG TPA: DUF3618 domain-containing protein [Burkholderiales bacterium]|nr:DUF3618 domain-containing protein [Burkholderiales bacterium]